MKKRTNTIINILLIILLTISLIFFKIISNKYELLYLLKWYLSLLLFTISSLPLTFNLFKRYTDLGYIFSKPLGILLAGFLMWLFSSFGLLKFNTLNSYLCLIIIALLSYGILILKKDTSKFINNIKNNKQYIYRIEIIILILLLLLSYIKGFNPSANSTEKFMDYGFMNIMNKTDYMPPIDLWFSGYAINYYYFGQYISTYITKIALVNPEYGYNFMLITLFILTLLETFSLSFNILSLSKLKKKYIYLGSIIASLSNTIAGNMHYVIYKLIIPILSKLQIIKYTANYYFADSTRYIKNTIHEFPSYSFILGDLHAHVINIIFVLTLLSLLLTIYLKNKNIFNNKRIVFNIKDALSPSFFIIGILLGIFKMTNYWDFPIYLTVSFLTLLFLNIIIYKDIKDKIISTLIEVLLLFTISSVISLPFTISFTKMASQVKLSPEHSPLYQLLILWLLPISLLITYITSTLRNINKKNIIINYFKNISITDLFMIIIGLCATGLILIPEIVYVKDIYVGDIRANTMFKLTYQSYIMFSLCFGYFIIKLINDKNKIYKSLSYVFLFLFTITLFYSYEGTYHWFGNIFKSSNYKSLNVKEFLNKDYIYYYLSENLGKNLSSYDINIKDDLAVINWLNKNANNTDTILESYGESYTIFNRISVFTGHPTPLGWETHEWLWRSDGKSTDYPEIISKRRTDINIIYISNNKLEIQKLIAKYKIKYIVIGYIERLNYMYDDIQLRNESELKELGEIVFESHTNNSNFPTYIIKIS